MKLPEIDETKLHAVQAIIEKIESVTVEKGCGEDSPELKALAQQLQEATGKNDLSFRPFMRYSSCVSLETAARIALMPVPQAGGLTDEAIRDLVLKLWQVEFNEAETDFVLKVLRLETGLRNITDYIYNPNCVGMDLHASVEEIIARILADKNRGTQACPFAPPGIGAERLTQGEES